MAKIFSKFSIVTTLIFSTIFFASCTNLSQEEASVSFTFKGSDFIPSRNVTASNSDSKFYLVAQISGEYSQTQTVEFSSSGEYSVTFNSVPIASDIFITADVFCPAATGHKEETASVDDNAPPADSHLYHGKTSVFSVVRGANDASVAVKNLMTEEMQKATVTFNFDGATTDDGSSLALWTSIKEGDGNEHKYQIVYNTLEPENAVVISEGLYTGSFSMVTTANSGDGLPITISLTEYASRGVTFTQGVSGGNNQPTFSDFIMVSEPKAQPTTVTNNEEKGITLKTAGGNTIIITPSA